VKEATAVQFCVFRFYFTPCLVSICQTADSSCALDAAVACQWRWLFVIVTTSLTVLLQCDGHLEGAGCRLNGPEFESLPTQVIFLFCKPSRPAAGTI
jgi:hypothetical protein